jgi:uncharacterized protein YraI
MMKLTLPAILSGVMAASMALAMGTASATPLVSPAKVRTGPGAEWPVIAEIPANADVRVLACYSGWEGGWCQVRYHKVKGYVDAGQLAPSGSSNVIVAPIVTTDIANLRKGPGKNWPSLAVIPSSTPVDVAYCSQGWLFGWCQVNYKGQTGYVNSVLLQRQGAVYSQ